MERLLTAAILDGYSPRKDRTITIRFITQEKTPDQIAEIHEKLDQYGYLYFKPTEELTREELDDLDKLDTDTFEQPKSQSQRLRSVLYVLWKKDSEGFAEFKDFYKFHTDRIINYFKQKIDDQ